MIFFYDWKKVFEKLSAHDVKALLLAMLEYRENGTEPPEFSGKAGIAAAFIFPQLKRSLMRSLAGSVGGKVSAEKRESREVFASSKSQANAEQTPTTKTKTETKTETKTKTENKTNTETLSFSVCAEKERQDKDARADKDKTAPERAVCFGGNPPCASAMHTHKREKEKLKDRLGGFWKRMGEKPSPRGRRVGSACQPAEPG